MAGNSDFVKMQIVLKMVTSSAIGVLLILTPPPPHSGQK